VVQDLQELAVAVQDQNALGAAVDDVGRAEVAANGHNAGPAIGAADLPLHGGRSAAVRPAALVRRLFDLRFFRQVWPVGSRGWRSAGPTVTAATRRTHVRSDLH